MAYTVSLSKDQFKFSASHFTIFSKSKSEHLHGHNYYARLSIEFAELDPSTGISVEFAKLKELFKTTCDAIDEKVLLPENSPYLKIKEVKSNIEVEFNKKFYSFPKEDCVKLKIVNTSSENLAQWLSQKMEKKLKDLGALSFTVDLEETRGQSVSYKKVF